MKRAELIEWGIIAITLIFGYKFLEAIITLLFQLIYGFDGRLIMADMVRIILVIGIYAAFFIILVKNCNKIATTLSPRAMLQVILIAIWATILCNIADIIYYIFESFKNDIQRNRFLEDNTSLLPAKYIFIVKCIQVVVALLVIYLSKNISDLLIHKNEADELVFDSKTEN